MCTKSNIDLVIGLELPVKVNSKQVLDWIKYNWGHIDELDATNPLCGEELDFAKINLNEIIIKQPSNEDTR